MEVTKAIVEGSYSYGGSKLVALDEDSIAYASGNGLRILSLSAGSNSFLWNENEPNGRRSGFTALAYCPDTKQIAVAPRSGNVVANKEGGNDAGPAVLIDTYPGKRLEKVITASNVGLEYLDLAFSRDGKYVMGISSLPEYILNVWNVFSGEIVASTKLETPCSFCSFNPTDQNKLVVGGEKGMYFYTINHFPDTVSLTFIEAVAPPDEDEMDEEDSEDEEEEDANLDAANEKEGENAESSENATGGPRKHFTCHCWGRDDVVYASTRSGSVSSFAHGTGEVLATAPGVFIESDVSNDDDIAVKVGADVLVMTRDHLIAAYADGNIRWINHTTAEFERELPVSSYTSVYNSLNNVGSGDEVTLQPVASCISPKFSTLVLGTSAGHIVSLNLGTGEDDDDADGVGEDLITQLHAELHAVPSYATCFVSGGPVPVLLNAGVDGKISVWNARLRTVVSKITYNKKNPSAYLSAASCPTKPIAALGTADGVLRILYVGGTAEDVAVKCIYRCKIANGAITSLLYHPQKPLLAAVSLSERQIFFIDSRADEKIRVVGVATLPENANPNTLAWRSAGGTEIIVGCANGTIIEVNAPPPASKGSNEELASKPVEMKEVAAISDTLQPLAMFMVGNGPIGGTQSLFMCTVDSKALLQYDLKTATRKLQLQPAARHQAHLRGILCHSVHAIDANTHLVATGGQDGGVVLWSVVADASTGRSSVSLLHTLHYHASPVVAICFNSDGTQCFTSSLQGAIFSWKLDRKRRTSIGGVSEADGIPYSQMNELIEPSESERKVELSYLGRLKKAAADRQAEENEKAKASRLKDLDEIKSELQQLLDHNAQVPELEFMDRDEFVIDLKGRDFIIEKGEERAQKLRKELTRANLAKDLLGSRLLELTWDSMDDKTKALHAFKSDTIVYNIGVEKVSEDKAQQLEKLLCLRRSELRLIRSQTGDKSAKGWVDTGAQLPLNEKLDWMVNEGLLAPNDDLIERSSEEEKTPEGGEDGEEGEEEEEEEDAKQEEEEELKQETEGLLECIYPPLALRTPAQKRMQIRFLQELVRLTKKKYNLKFENMFAMKQDKFDQINSKNNRIKEILGELKTEGEYFVPEWKDDEWPERFSKVTDEEMPFERYVTEAERKRLAEEEEERKRREANKDEDNAPQRALNEMMGGTLEEKTEANALEIELVREEWMDELLYEEMSEEQRKLVEEFEAKQKALNEEKEKYRKNLELELKKIHSEIADFCASYDQKLAEFIETRSRTLEAIFTQELYILRLALLLLEKEDDAAQLSKLRKERAELIAKKKLADEKLANFRTTVLNSKNDLDRMKATEKQMEKDFKRLIQLKGPNGMLDQDTMAILVTLYKSRPVAKSDDMSSKDPSLVFDAASNTNDPYADIIMNQLANLPEKKVAAERAAAMQPLDLENEMPEGFEISQAILDELQKLRMEKIKFECDLKEQAASLKILQDRENALSDAALQYLNFVNENDTLISELKARMDFNSNNHEVLVLLRQGYVEVAQEAVVTDYSDACLINRNLIEERNVRIRELGDKKVGVLDMIKEFNKKINLMKWETNYLKMMEMNLEEKYLDLHMLRVTKDLQSFLKGGANVDRHKVDYEKAEKKLAYIQKAHGEKVKKLMRLRTKREKEVRQKQNENSRLATHVNELEKNVAVRASIHRARSSGGDGGVDPNAASKARMKAVVTRRKLLDLARAQTDEIEFLRQELDRLRQRTFPSFATRRDGQMNPDEMY